MFQGVRPVGPARGRHGDEGDARFPDRRVVVLRDRDLVAIRSQEVLEFRLRHRRAPLPNELKAPRIEIEPDDGVPARGETRQHRRPNPPEPDDRDGLFRKLGGSPYQRVTPGAALPRTERLSETPPTPRGT